MEQMQTNMMLLNMVQQMAQQPIAKPAVECAKNEPSEFQKELEQQTQAAQTEKRPDETVRSEKPEQTEKPVQENSDTEQLQNAQELARQVAQAGLIWADTNAVAVETVAQTDAQVAVVMSAAAVVEAPVQQNVQGEQAAQPELTAMQAEEVAPVQVEMTPEQAMTQSGSEYSQTGTELTAKQPEQVEDVMSDKGDEVEVTDVETGPEAIFRNVREVMVKVGEAPAAEASSETANVEEQITGKLTEALKLGESKVEIQLTPESLGSVKVELTRSADGTLSVILSAENSRTGNLLEKHSNALQNLLMNNGQERVQVEVHNAQESQQHQQHDFADGHNGNQEGRQQEQQDREQPNAQDFLQQLRLGLVSMDAEAS